MKFESPIEEKLYNALATKLRAGVVVETQVPILSYRVDMLIRSARTIVIECDGKDFHDFEMDRTRDLRMLDDGTVTDVLRLRGCDIVFDCKSCVDQILMCFPFLADAAAEPADNDVKCLIGLNMRDPSIKPIWRTVCNDRMPESHRDTETCYELGRTKGGRIAYQFKSAQWDRAFKGRRIWHLGDWMSYQTDQAKKTGKAHPDLLSWAKLLNASVKP
jgi:very-short-patch-repair endonuclease